MRSISGLKDTMQANGEKEQRSFASAMLVGGEPFQGHIFN